MKVVDAKMILTKYLDRHGGELGPEEYTAIGCGILALGLLNEIQIGLIEDSILARFGNKKGGESCTA